MEIYGKAYIKENGTMDRVSCKGNAYTCPAFEVRVMDFTGKRDVLVVGQLDYTEAQEMFTSLGYHR